MKTAREIFEVLHPLEGGDLKWPRPWAREVTPEAIKHFALGAGDHNPRWTDPDDGHAGRIAPPLFALSAMDSAVSGVDFAELPLRWRHIGWSVERLQKPGDRVSASATMSELRVVEDGDGVVYRLEVIFTNGLDERVAHGNFVVERVLPTVPDAPREPHQYDPDLVEEISKAIAGEAVAAETPTWANLTPGERLPTVVRGPLNHFDIAFHLAGVGYAWQVGRSANRWERSYFEDRPARDIGLAGASAPSSLQLVWLTTQVTNWLGSGGDLVSVEVELERPIMIGDTTWFDATVERTWSDRDQHGADLSLTAMDQLGRGVSHGSATVRLPHR
jgi:acyl dehydratase